MNFSLLEDLRLALDGAEARGLKDHELAVILLPKLTTAARDATPAEAAAFCNRSEHWLKKKSTGQGVEIPYVRHGARREYPWAWLFEYHELIHQRASKARIVAWAAEKMATTEAA